MDPNAAYDLFRREIERLKVKFNLPKVGVRLVTDSDGTLAFEMDMNGFMAGTHHDKTYSSWVTPEWMRNGTWVLLYGPAASDLTEWGAVHTARHEFAHVLAVSILGDSPTNRSLDSHETDAWFHACEMVDCHPSRLVLLNCFELAKQQYIDDRRTRLEDKDLFWPEPADFLPPEA